MIGVRGRLVSESFVEQVLPTLPAFRRPSASVIAALDRWSERCEAGLGPASSVRAIADVCVLPLLRLLGLDVTRREDAAAQCRLETAFAGTRGPVVIVTTWNEPLGRAWRDAVLHSIVADASWCLCCNGHALRLVDARRTWSREYLEFDLTTAAGDGAAVALLWTVARADAIACPSPLLDLIADLSAKHGSQVCRALGAGVLEALTLLLQAIQSPRAGRLDAAVVFEQSLTVLYRVLFLLFAEARGLVPLWHPVYRDRYSLDAIVDAMLAGRRYEGLWQALSAISRLAHAGCEAGDLKVTAFNGRLFSPRQSAALAHVRIGDDVMGRVVAAVGTTAAGPDGKRSRIAYRDLDVEQLGAVYERVLDYRFPAGGIERHPTRDARKSSGTFYTPRAVTAFLVRRTLEPLVRGKTAQEILALRVVDPAMGSGAFLVGACRFLAQAAEEALVCDGEWHGGDVDIGDRAGLRRAIASRCLYGVDLNPMAVQLARLSLWLATLASGQPLSFLDHRLVAGDSLIGATPDDVRRQPGKSRRSARHEGLPLFETAALASTLEHAVRVRDKLAAAPDDSPAAVHAKERALAALGAEGTPVNRWSRVLDLWCAGWFWNSGTAPDAATARELGEQLLSGRSVLPPRLSQPLLEVAAAVAADHRFLHWPLVFPEVFADASGRPQPCPGFDAVIGNPPWDMVRGDSGDADIRTDRRRDARQMVDFVRESGIYHVDGRAHLNRYQLFLERALQLVRPGGRVGLVLPSGAMSDSGAGALRRHLFEHAEVDSVTGLDNRGAIFPIHRGLRFVLLTCTAGRPTAATACRFGITRAEELDETGAGTGRGPLLVTRALLSRLSGDDDLGLPELATTQALRIVERVSATVPWLAAESGWHVHFGRELNATDDRGLFVPFSGSVTARPVVEGKQIEPFRAAVERSHLELPAGADPAARVARRARLAYRDVASATNRLTLIAAIVPARAVTTHTLFCLKTPLPIADQQALCALLNSFVANYLVRLRVNTHVTTSLLSRLPVPFPGPQSTAHARLAALSATLAATTGNIEESEAYAELQALAARLYQLSSADFEYVLETFPLIPKAVRAAALLRFNDYR
jgi:hypothetical protein